MNRVLHLATVAQALLDAIEETDEEDLESALSYLSLYPQLVERLMRMSPQQRQLWYEAIERAMGRKK